MQRHRWLNPPYALLPILAAALATGGCKAPQAFGDRNSVIVRADSELWLEVEGAVREALERPVFSTRNETEFKVTFVADDDTVWNDLRMWQNVLVLAGDDDPVAQKIIGTADAEAREAPALIQTEDIWARGQTVSLVLAPEANRIEGTVAALGAVYDSLQSSFDIWVLERMFASGVNDSLSEVLSAFGFTLDFPSVYVHGREDSLFRFRNVHPNPATRIRTVTVTWMSGDSASTDVVDASRVLDWRRSFAETAYDPPQDVLDDKLRFDTLAVNGARTTQVRGVWQDRGDFPAAGPFTARALNCPEQNRTYYIDAWLYSPGEDKYQYIRQLEIILDSFSCSDEEPLRLSAVFGVPR